jgi:hypothetical protein
MSKPGKRLIKTAEKTEVFASDDAKRRKAITNDIEARIHRAIRDGIAARNAHISDRREK